MVFSSLRRRYNDLKDPPDHQERASINHVKTRTAGVAANHGLQEELHGNSHSKEASPPSSTAKEKDDYTAAINSNTTGDDFADDDPAVKDIPWTVRRIVSLHDEPTLPTLTFRYFVLTPLFVIPGAFLSQMSHFRTTSAPYSVLFVQIASNYAGLLLARILPVKFIRIPCTKYGFNLNPGPWSIKEHVLVTISAASGANYNLA